MQLLGEDHWWTGSEMGNRTSQSSFYSWICLCTTHPSFMFLRSWVNGLHHGLLRADQGVESRAMVPKDVHILVPKTWDGVTLDGKKDFADMINLRFLSWEIILDYLGEPNIMTKSFQQRQRRSQSQKKEMWWWSQRLEWYTLKMEKRPWAKECKEAPRSWKAQGDDSFLKPPEVMQPPPPPFYSFDLHSYSIIFIF